MGPIIRFYHYLNMLSVDVAMGTIISALFFAKIFHVSIKPYGLIALGLTVWIIYTIDHLKDAKKIRRQASTRRHRFHQQNFRTLLIVVGAVLILDFVTIFFVRRQVFEWGLVLALLVALYLIGQRSFKLAKEVFIAFLYSCGVLLPSIAIAEMAMDPIHYLIIIQFGVIAWINLVMFSWFDYAFDTEDDQHSFVTIAGKKTTEVCLYVLITANFCVTIIQITFYGFTTPVSVLMLMNSTLFLIFFFRNRLSKNDLYRLLGDAVFLFPILSLL